MVTQIEFEKARTAFYSNSQDVMSKFIVVSYYLEQQQLEQTRQYMKDIIDKLNPEQLLVLFTLLHKEISRINNRPYYSSSVREEDMLSFISILQKLYEKKVKEAESWLLPSGQSHSTLLKWVDSYPRALHALGDMYYRGSYGMPKSDEAALKYLIRSYEHSRDSDTANLIGNIFYKEQKKYDQAIRYFKLASDAGNRYGSYNTALCYLNGQGVSKSLTDAANYFEKSTQQVSYGEPYIKAHYQCAKVYRLLHQESQTGQSRTYYSYGRDPLTQCKEHYKKAADNNDETAAYELACLYQEEKNDREAEGYFKKAAAKKHVDSCVRLWKLYKAQNRVSEAKTYRQEAIAVGNAEAMYDLGCEYEASNQFNEAFQSIYKASKKEYALAKEKLQDGQGRLVGYFNLYQSLAKEGDEFEVVFEAMRPYLVLQGALNYYFLNTKYLLAALNRKLDPITKEAPFQKLEFLGDGILTTAIREYFVDRCPAGWLTGDLEYATQSVVSNAVALPRIAQQLKLSALLTLDESEKTRPVTDKMQADALEALIGAISQDYRSSAMADKLTYYTKVKHVIHSLWQAALEAALKETPRSERQLVAAAVPVLSTRDHPSATAAVSSASSVRAYPAAALFAAPTGGAASASRPLSPATQRVFTAIGGSTAAEVFEGFVSKMSDVNGRNIGKTGDTPLMTLVRNKKLRPEKEEAKINVLLRYGALWTSTNSKGDSADKLLKEKHPDMVIKFRI